MERRKVKNGEKSPWGQCLTRPVPNGRRLSGFLGAIHSNKISGNFGPKLNGSVRSNRKSFEKTGPPFEVVLFSGSDRSECWLNGSRPLLVPENLCFSGTNQKPERRRPFGTGLVRHCPQGLFSPFFTFLRATFFRPFRYTLTFDIL